MKMEIIKITDKEKEYIDNDVLAINKVWYNEELLRHNEIKKGEKMLNNLETREQYYFDRKLFCGTFAKYMDLDVLYDCFDCRIYELDNFLFVRENDEYYIIDTDSLIVINWYKHLGRCNRVSKDITIEEFETFCERIGEKLKGKSEDGEN